MYKFFLYFLLLNTSFLFSQTKPDNAGRPKLVVGIVVDQMRADYISRFWSKYSEGGFKRMINTGFNYKNANYNYVPTFTGPGHASIYTGTTPSVHGIIANDWYSRDANAKVYCASDPKVLSVGALSTAGMMSPHRMLSTTIGDELKLANPKSKVIGIALKDRGAILPAGHSANGAYWFEGSGNWISSSWYMKELPQWVKDFNAKKLAKEYLMKGWFPLLPIEQYTESQLDDTPYEAAPNKKEKPTFPYEYSKFIEKNNYEIIKSTPHGNTITADFAKSAIAGEQLGKDDITDMLCISFSSTDYIGHSYGIRAIETEDIYLRLDLELEKLFQYLDAEVGVGNYISFLTADHGGSDVPAFLKDIKIPAGYFNPKAFEKELKTFLVSNYGDSLVLNFDNEQVYLNEAMLFSKKINKCDIEKVISEFVLKFPGVAEAYCSCDLKTEAYPKGTFRNILQNGYHFKRSGNVAINLEPNWFAYMPKGTTHGACYSYDTHVPLLFFGAGIPNGGSVEKVSITDIAPTLSMILNISFTSGCSGIPLKEVSQK